MKQNEIWILSSFHFIILYPRDDNDDDDGEKSEKVTNEANALNFDIMVYNETVMTLVMRSVKHEACMK